MGRGYRRLLAITRRPLARPRAWSAEVSTGMRRVVTQSAMVLVTFAPQSS